MKRLSRGVWIALVLAAVGCDFTSVPGSGHLVTQTRTVSGFSKVSLAGSAELTITQTGDESLTITADDNLMDDLTSDVVGGELRLGTKDHMNLRPTKPVVYRLTVKSLSNIDAAGSVKVTGARLDADRLTAKLAGSGDLTLGGKARQQDISLAGSGSYDGEDLKTEVASIHIAGSGSAIVAASATLDVEIAGSGSVDYIGDPTVTRHVMGSGSIHKR